MFPPSAACGVGRVKKRRIKSNSEGMLVFYNKRPGNALTSSAVFLDSQCCISDRILPLRVDFRLPSEGEAIKPLFPLDCSRLMDDPLIPSDKLP